MKQKVVYIQTELKTKVMKEYIDKLVKLALIFSKLSHGNNLDLMENKVEIYFTHEAKELMITFNNLVEINFWTESSQEIEFNIKDISRLSEIPKIIGECEEYLEDVRNTIKSS